MTVALAALIFLTLSPLGLGPRSVQVLRWLSGASVLVQF